MIDFLSRRRLLALGLLWPVARLVMANQVSTPITALAATQDGQKVIVGSQRGIDVFDLATQERIHSWDTAMHNVHDIAFSPDWKSMVVAGGVPGELGSIELRHWPSGKLIRNLELHDDVVYSVAFNESGSHLVTASADEVCQVIEVGQTKASTRFTKHSRAVMASLFLNDSRTIVSASRDQTLRVWESETGEPIRTLHNHSNDVYALCLKPGDGLPLVASASADRTIRFWQPTIGRMVRFIRLDAIPLNIAWNESGDRIFAGCDDGTLRIVDPVNVKELNSIPVAKNQLTSLDVIKDEFCVVGRQNGTLELLSVR